ncbi:MAG: hypothetical protein KBG12_04705 [Syntrophobacterales bacterium]|nr:hypothetical protein [Syntrophobacterales bacterium]
MRLAAFRFWALKAVFVVHIHKRQLILDHRDEVECNGRTDLPGHGSSRVRRIPEACNPPLARAAVAVGADGIIVEVHPEPGKALSDGMQSLKPEKFYRLMNDLAVLSAAMQRLHRLPS